MGIEFGNGINGRWVGYFSKGFQEVVIDVDGSTLLPLEEQVGGATVTFGSWVTGNRVKAMLTLSSTSTMELKLQSAENLQHEQSRIVACGDQSQSIRVDGRPSVKDLTIDVGVLQEFPNIRYAAISVRNGEATSQPMGSTWGQFVGFPEVVVPTEALFAAEDTLCREIAGQRVKGKLSDRATGNEMFGDARDRDRAVKRKQLRSDIVKPHAEALARGLGKNALVRGTDPFQGSSRTSRCSCGHGRLYWERPGIAR